MKINILGTEYEFNTTSETEDVSLCGMEGYCDRHAKKIAIETVYNRNDPGMTKDCDSGIRLVKRHEIIHAYFSESGLTDYCQDEVVVEWIAWMFPRLLKTFKEVDAID